MGIAVIGWGGRFPGAGSPAELWRSLAAGVESIARFSRQEMLTAGVAQELVERDDYVGAGGMLEGIERFDADFFGYPPREAALIDPQQRLLLECAWEALEDAGYPPSRFPGRIGVFAGVGINTYLLRNLAGLSAIAPEERFQAFVASDKDFATTRVSYKLDLRGPSLDVQTACSSSLVAVHLACQSLLLGECDLALAGGCSIHVPQRQGYLYQKEGIESPDGHCRAFDRDAAGTVFGNGAGLVVLRRLEEATEAADSIRAVIRGSAVNNDGADKLGYTAPSFQGQLAVAAEAMAMAGISADSLAFVEAHGTGTALGDAVEIQALSRLFASHTPRRGFCALGSVKTAVGHLDTAAGVAGLIKAASALEHRLLPPSPYFRNPNPELEGSPFFVNAAPHPLAPGAEPLRAGVSSAGIGGTNAHVVLEEAPPAARSPAHRAHQLLVVSARSEAARERALEGLAAALDGGDGAAPGVDLADVAYTLQVGRERFPYRAIVVAESAERAATALGEVGDAALGEAREPPQRLCFLCPGQGAQHVGMGRGLYGVEPVFTETLDEAAEILRPLLGEDLISLLYPADSDAAGRAAELLEQTRVTQPAVFACSVAMARLLGAWGLEPGVLLGHSLGEYTAACLAGVFPFVDGLRLVAARGHLIQALPRGEMAAVSATPEEVADRLVAGTSLAAVNGPRDLTLSGEPEALRQTLDALIAAGLSCRPLRTSHAFHSPMMEPALAALREELAGLGLRPPRVPVISNLTGEPLSAEQATDPDYWCRHLRQPVRFSAALARVLSQPATACLELAPGQTLTALARRHPDRREHHLLVAAARHPRDEQDDAAYLLRAAGRLWLAGVEPDWQGMHPAQRRGRVPLPTYPFERQRHWIEAPPPGTGAARSEAAGDAEPAAQVDPTPHLYLPSWQRHAGAAGLAGRAEGGASGVWLLFEDAANLTPRLAAALGSRGATPVRITPGAEFQRLAADRFQIRPGEVADHRELLAATLPEGGLPTGAVYGWGLGRAAPNPLWFHGLVALAQALDERPPAPLTLAVLADRLFDVTGGEPLDPAPQPGKALLLGLARCLALELPHARCLCLDPGRLEPQEGGGVERLLAALLDAATPPVLAYRGASAWRPALAPFSPPPASGGRQEAGGAFLILGGTGRVGLEAAAVLAEGAGGAVHLYLTGRTALPADGEAPHPATGPAASRRARLAGLERAGATVHLRQLDAADAGATAELVREIVGRHGRLAGVIHAAGRIDASSFAPVAELDAERCAAHFRPKVAGLDALAAALEGAEVGFCMLFSSLSTLLGGVGYAAYAAANAYLDAYCRARSRSPGTPWLSVAWDAWDFADESAVAGRPEMPGLRPVEGREVLARLLAAGAAIPGGEVLVSRGPLMPRWRAWQRAARAATAPGSEPVALPAADAPPLARIWCEVLGVAAVDPGQGFFSQGGSSLLALQLLSRVRRELGADLSLGDFLGNPAFADLERLVAAARPGATPPAEIPRAPRDRPLPLSFGQERLWLAEQDPALRGTQHLTAALELSGRLDVTALGRAFDDLVARHESLRTRFVTAADGEPRQEVVEARDGLLRVRPFDAPAGTDLEAALAATAREELTAPFDLGAGLLARVCLLVVDSERHVLLITLHHIAADDWSIGILLDELATLYAAAADGRSQELPELPLRYADFAAWQRRRVAAGGLADELTWWSRRLAGAPDGPAEAAEGDDPEGAGGYHGFTIPGSLAGRLAALGEDLGASRFMTLLAAFGCLLHARSGVEDLVVGTPVAGRDHPLLASLVGYFINPVVLRTDLAGDPTFLEVVERVRDTTLEAHAHGELPFDHLEASLRPQRGGAPLFRTWFTLLTHTAEKALHPDLRTRSLQLGPRPPRFELALVLEPSSGDLLAHLEYRPGLLTPATAARLGDDYLHLLEAVAAAPERRLGDLAAGLRRSASEARDRQARELESKRRKSFPTARRQIRA